MVARCMMAGNCGPDPETKQDQGGNSMASLSRGGAATYAPRETGVMSSCARADRAFTVPRCEHEGAHARLSGKTVDDCPYDATTQSLEWRSWVCGFGYAAAELMVLNDGRYFVSQSESPPSDFDLNGPSIPIRDAIEKGYWQPRYVTLATLDEIERGGDTR